MNVTKFFGLLACLAWSASVPAKAGEKGTSIDSFREKGYSVTSVTLIFGQLLKMSYPKSFLPVFVDVKPEFYLQESVPKGETVNNWTQMVSVTGRKGLALRPDVTPRAFLNVMAGGFQRACPSSYAIQPLDDLKLDGFDAVAGVVSCGLSPTTSGKTSETALIVVIKGQTDFYTVQWSERGTRSEAPSKIDTAKWQARLKAMSPIKLCPIIPGEKPPYPSCIGGERAPA